MYVSSHDMAWQAFTENLTELVKLLANKNLDSVSLIMRDPVGKIVSLNSAPRTPAIQVTRLIRGPNNRIEGTGTGRASPQVALETNLEILGYTAGVAVDALTVYATGTYVMQGASTVWDVSQRRYIEQRHVHEGNLWLNMEPPSYLPFKPAPRVWISGSPPVGPAPGDLWIY